MKIVGEKKEMKNKNYPKSLHANIAMVKFFFFFLLSFLFVCFGKIS